MILTKEHYEFIDLYLEGRNITEISKVLNKSRQTLYTWLKYEGVQVEIENRKSTIRKEAKDKINMFLNTCVDEMKELALNSTDQRVKLQAIKYLMDRALGTPTATKEDTIVSNGDDKNNDDTLEERLNKISKMTVVK